MAGDPSGTTRACGCPRHWHAASDRSATCGTRGSPRSCSSTRESEKRRLKDDKTCKVGLNEQQIHSFIYELTMGTQLKLGW